MLTRHGSPFTRLVRGRRALRWLLRLCVLLAAATAVMPAALAQNLSDPRFQSCTWAVGQEQEWIELTVVATRLPATDTTPEKLFWKIKEMPGESKVSVRCAGLKQRIVEVLAGAEPGPGTLLAMAKTAPGMPPNTNAFRLGEYLGNNINNFRFDIEYPGGLFDINTDMDIPPLASEVGIEAKVVLCVRPDPSVPCAGPPPRAEFEIATATGRTATLPGINAAAVGTPAVPVRLLYSAEDLAAAKKDPAITTDEAAHGLVRAELLKVAETAYTTLQAQTPKPLDDTGKPIFNNRSDPQAQVASANYVAEMRRRYRLKADIFDIGWTAQVDADQQCRGGCGVGATEAAVWVWSVDGLRLVEGVQIEVVEEDWETKEVQGETIAAKLKKRRQTAYEKLTNGPNHPNLTVKPGRIMTRTEGEADIAELKPHVEAVDKVKSASTPQAGTANDHRVIYAVRRKKKPELTLALNAAGSYSKEEGGTGRLGAEETNLLRLKETIALSAEGGGEVQRYKFSFSRPFKRSDTPRFEIRDFSINAQVFKDKDRRLGNLTADEIAARETGSSAHLSFGYDSIGANDRANENCVTDTGCARKRTRFSFLADASLNYHDVNIPDDDKLLTITGVPRELLPAARTQTTTLSLGVNALLRHDFRKSGANGLGVLVLRLDETAEKGFHLFGADYRYWKSRTVVSGDLTFGFTSYRDMFVRYRHGHVRGSEDTPIFELPLLGGAESVRGLEEGEFIGRRVSYDQFELGFNVASIWNRFTRKGRIGDSIFCPCDRNSKGPQGPFEFKNLYVKGFFDHGRLADSPVTAAAGGALSRANGYGVAVELRDLMADESGRRLNLSIGYGRSPHSRLHRSGLMFTGVTFDF